MARETGLKDKQYNGQRNRTNNTMVNETGLMTNNDVQNNTQKTKDRAARIPLKNGMNSGTNSQSLINWFS